MLDKLLQKEQIYIDKENPKTTKGSYKSASTILKKGYEYFEKPEQQGREISHPEIEMKDIMQGQLADCYFLSAIASVLSSSSTLISKLFLFRSNPCNFFAVRLFVDGEWRTICTDDQMPC